MATLRFAGMHCAVVGGTGRIGGFIAKAFAHQGASVTVLGRTASQRQPYMERELCPPEADQEHQARPRLPHRFINLDVGDHEGIKRILGSPSRPGASQVAEESESLEENVGPIDILVNCAGVTQQSLLKRTSEVSLMTIVDTNLVSTMVVCKYAQMRPHGCIINVSSLMANKGGLGATAYAASKAGLVGKFSA
ncbi:hypothetical protein HIM_00103 [Hirsutella minnesotensis 3608]|nr:hypothetical protein HIM_00103 [Hirsutella minnesotensis 3608]